MRARLGHGLPSVMRWESGLVLASLLVIALGVDASDQFLTNGNFFYLSVSIGEVAIMTLPLTFIIITGEIDLSVASILGLSSALVGYLWSHGWPMPAIIPAVLVVGIVAGAFNGFLITRVGLPSLAVTIGTLTLYRGIAVILLGPNTISNFPFRYTKIGVEPFPHTSFLSYSAVIFLVLAVVFGVVLHFTPFGRSLYAIGSNKEAATLRRDPGQADQDAPVHPLGPRLLGGRDPLHVPPLDRRPEQRARAGADASSRSSFSAASRSSAAAARSSASSSPSSSWRGCRTRSS